MKKLLLALLMFVSYSTLNAQAFTENFDGGTVNMVTSGPGTWTIDNTLSTSSPNSYKGVYGVSQYASLETPPNAINATGNAFVVLSFKQICKIEFVDSAKIEVSTDGGVTWKRLYDHGAGNQNCIYLGSSPAFGANENFNETSYGLDWNPGNNTIPLNSWWKNESFDISALCANQPDVRVRWKSLDVSNIPGPGFTPRYGWLIDDINVQIATCELNAPVFGTITPNLVGTIYSLNTQDIFANVTDASGLSYAELSWTVNSGPLQQFGGMFDLSGTGTGPWAGTLSNFGSSFNDLDTICWYIDVTDASGCNNSSTFPGVGQTQCFVVSSGVKFPYCDSFDGPVPIWTADPSSIGDLWNLGTPANGTLSTTHSGTNVWGIGLTTAYSANDESYLLSPVFDFSTTPVCNLSFWLKFNTETNYDGVRLEYALNAATPSWQTLGSFNPGNNGKNWYNLATIFSSNQSAWAGNSTNEPGNVNGWLKATYKLGSVPGLGLNPTGVQMRFVFNSDAFATVEGFLIDDFCIIVPPANDIGVVAYIQPIAGAGQAAGSSVPFSVTVENFGTSAQTGFNVGYSITGQGTVSVPFVGALAVNSTITVPLPNITVPSGGFTVCTWTDLTGDGDRTNDTLCTNLVGVPKITPTFCDDFEGINNGWVSTTVGAANSDWQLGNPTLGATPGGNNGSANAWDINLTAIYGNNAQSELYTPYFDFSTIANGKLSFAYNFNTETNYDGTRLDFSTNGGATWNLLGTGGGTATPIYAGTDPCGINWYSKASIFSSNTNAWAGNSNGWKNASYKLCCTNGILLSSSLVQFRFTFTSDASVVVTNGTFSIDDFCITSSTGDDVGVSAITSPVVGGFPVGVQAHVVVTIENYGSTVVTSFPVTYLAAGIPHTFIWTGSIAPCGSTSFAFPDSIGIASGANDICAFTGLVGDVNLSNDTTCITVIGQPVLTSTYTLSFSDNLESGNIGYAPSVNPLGDPGTIWEYGTPNYLLTTGAHSPVNAWDINLNAPSGNAAFAYLTTPYFHLKGNANSQHAVFRFFQNRDMDAFTDQFYVEYRKGSNGGAWTKLGFNGDPNGTNWYNVTDNWNAVSGWSQSSYEGIDKLFTAANPDSIIQFRFVYTTGNFSGSSGVSVDDIELFIPIPLSVTPLSVTLSVPNSLILPGQPITFAAPIKNNGYNPVFIHNVSLVIDGAYIGTDLVNYSSQIGGPLAKDATIIHNFNTTWIASPGYHTACVYTDTPNGITDYSLSDDTICSAIQVFDSVTTTALPYCNDFESGNSWVTLDAISYSKRTSFELGTPNQANLNAAHSGLKAWTLYVDSNYVNRDSSGLFSAMLRVQTGHCYKLDFWQQFRTEFGSDGGTVEYSDNLGVSWKRIDFTGTPGILSTGAPGTNYSYVVSLDPNDPSKKGFTGASVGWIKTQQTLRPNIDGLIIVRWRFASDYSARDEGWSIDDVCFTDLGICTPIGVNEFAIDDFGLSQNYPNPSNGNTTIEFAIPKSGNVTIQVVDMLGQIIDVIISEKASEGKHTIEYNTSKLAPGIYTYTMKYDNRQVTKRMVITE